MPKLVVTYGNPTVFLMNNSGTELRPRGRRSHPLMTESWVYEPMILIMRRDSAFHFHPRFVTVNVDPVRAVNIFGVQPRFLKHVAVAMRQNDVGIEMKEPIFFG